MLFAKTPEELTATLVNRASKLWSRYTWSRADDPKFAGEIAREGHRIGELINRLRDKCAETGVPVEKYLASEMVADKAMPFIASLGMEDALDTYLQALPPSKESEVAREARNALLYNAIFEPKRGGAKWQNTLMQKLLADGAEADGPVTRYKGDPSREELTTPFLWAIERNLTFGEKSYGMVQVLLKAGAHTGYHKREKKLPLALAFRDQWMLELLLQPEYKTDINERDPESGNTVLFRAACSNSPSPAAFLMGHGADATLRNNEGDTPLQVCIQRGYRETFDAMMDGIAKLSPEARRDIFWGKPEVETNKTPLHTLMVAQTGQARDYANDWGGVNWNNHAERLAKHIFDRLATEMSAPDLWNGLPLQASATAWKSLPAEWREKVTQAVIDKRKADRAAGLPVPDIAPGKKWVKPQSQFPQTAAKRRTKPGKTKLTTP